MTATAADLVALARAHAPAGQPGEPDRVCVFLCRAFGFDADEPHFEDLRRRHGSKPDPDVAAVVETIERLRLRASRTKETL